MGVFDWLRGRPRDTQEERVEARQEAPAEAAGNLSDPGLGGKELDSAIDVRRDEEAMRHGGI
jgi:hypothetical protein